MRVLSVFLFAYIFSQFYRSFLAVVASSLATDLGLSPSQLGNLTAIWFIVFALSQFLVGYLLDRHGPRRTIALMMLFAVGGAVLFARAGTYGEALTGMGLIGLGCAPILMGSLYYFGRTTDPARFPVYTSLMVGLGNFGNLAGSMPLAHAASAIGWRMSMLVIAGLTLIAAILVWMLIKDPPPAEQTGPRRNALQELWQIVGFRPLWPVFFLNFISYSVIAAERGLWIGPYLEQIHGFDTIARGNAALLMAIGMALGALAVGWLVPVFGTSKRVAVFGNLGTAAAFLALGLLPGLGGWAATALLTCAGLFGMCYGVIISHARLFFPAHLLGRGVTFANFLSIGGAGIMLSASGYAVSGATAAGWAPQAVFSAMHLGFAAILLIACAYYLTSPTRPGKLIGQE